MFTKTRATQCWPEVSRSVECIVTVFECEDEEPSSTITPVSWKARKASHQPAGPNSADVFDRTSRYLTFSLAFLSLFSLLSSPISPCACLVSLFCHSLITLSLQPPGCCQGANSDALHNACIHFWLIPSIFSHSLSKRAKQACIFAQLTKVMAQLGSSPCTPRCKQPCWCSNLAKSKIKWAQIPQTLWGWYFNDILLRLNQKTLTTVTVRRLYSEHRSVKMRMTVEFLTDICTFSFLLQTVAHVFLFPNNGKMSSHFQAALN